jgi:hypothetical protein
VLRFVLPNGCTLYAVRYDFYTTIILLPWPFRVSRHSMFGSSKSARCLKDKSGGRSGIHKTTLCCYIHITCSAILIADSPGARSETSNSSNSGHSNLKISPRDLVSWSRPTDIRPIAEPHQNSPLCPLCGEISQRPQCVNRSNELGSK